MVLEQLPRIKEQLETIKPEIQARVEKVMAMTVTEENSAEAKKVRAALNAEHKSFDARRMEIKKQYMKAFEEFDAKYKECITKPYDEADKLIKGKITEVDNKITFNKESDVIFYFNEYIKAKNIDWLKFADTGIKVTLSSSLPAAKRQVKEFVERVAEDITMIDSLANKDEILVEYKKVFNVSQAVNAVTERHRLVEEEKKQREQREQAAAAQQQAAAKVETVIAPPVEAPKEAPAAEPVKDGTPCIVKAAFEVIGTLDEIKSVKAFMDAHKIEYHSVSGGKK
jgi:transcription initiation factor TFIID subunit TAF12